MFLNAVTSLHFFFEMEGETPGLCIEKMHTAFFIKLFSKQPTKITHQNNLKQPHNTLCLENMKKSHQLGTGTIRIPQNTL